MQPPGNFDENEQFVRLTHGDEKAFSVVFYHYFPYLVAFVSKITHTRHTAEEITQEVFLRLWQKKEQFEYTTSLDSWLFAVAANLAFDHLKKEAQKDKLVAFYRKYRPADDTSALLSYRETRTIIETAVEQLPEQQKLVYKLSREDGLSHQEIAGHLGVTVNTVKSHIGKALKTLRDILKKAAYLFFSIFF